MAKHPNGGGSITAHRSRNPAHRPSLWAGFIAIQILLAIIAFRVLGDKLYDFATPTAKDPKNALVVCLAGGKFRIESAIDIFAKGTGKALLIIGAGEKSTSSSILRTHAERVNPEFLSTNKISKIEVETQSRNTIENAFAVTRYVQQNSSYKEIILITSGYHMKRAKLMLESQLGENITVIPMTPEGESLGLKNWWHSWLGIQITGIEYFKYLLAAFVIPKLGII